jgi:prepilin-type processing-associated H-X9-DG protein
MNRRRAGLSIVEVLVVLGILGILTGLLLPGVQSARDAASRIACVNNLRQMALGCHTYSASSGRLPPSGLMPGKRDPGTGLITPIRDPRTGIGILSWFTHLLGQVDQTSLYKDSLQACQIQQTGSLDPPHIGFSTPMRLYACPADSRYRESVAVMPNGLHVAMTDYLGFAGSFVGKGVFDDGSGNVHPSLGAFGDPFGLKLNSVLDGLSQTVMITERPPPDSLEAGQWYQCSRTLGAYDGPDGVLWYRAGATINGNPCPASVPFGPGVLENPCDRYHPWSLHRGGANFAFLDGSVRFLSYSVSRIMPDLITIAGGETPEIP